MGALLWAPLLASLAMAAAALFVPRPEPVRYAGVAVSTVILATGIALATAVMNDRIPATAGGHLRADALSSYMLAVVGAVGLTATWGGLRKPGSDFAERSYAALICLFLGAMSLALLADNLGIMWVAVEATTIATAFLVGFHRTRRSLEAAWKYVVIGSVGVAIALLGLVLLYAAARGAGAATLSWARLHDAPPSMDPALVRMAAGLAVLGFATKAGLAPMHSWLPDAHSEAPAPVSALMSGVLLSVAFYAILRIQAIAAPVAGAGFIRGMLVVAALASLAVAAALILKQRDYKRLLAYSSIEHMGLLALGAAIGSSLAIAAVLLHVLGHGLAKATMFVVSGRVLAAEGTTSIDGVRALLARRPGLGIPWIAGMAALLGLPPFSLFFSEVGIFVAGWQAGMGVVSGVALLLLLLAVAGTSRLVASITFGGHDAPDAEAPDRSAHGPWAPLVLALGTCAVVAFLATPVGTLLGEAASVLGAS